MTIKPTWHLRVRKNVISKNPRRRMRKGWKLWTHSQVIKEPRNNWKKEHYLLVFDSWVPQPLILAALVRCSLLFTKNYLQQRETHLLRTSIKTEFNPYSYTPLCHAERTIDTWSLQKTSREMHWNLLIFTINALFCSILLRQKPEWYIHI